MGSERFSTNRRFRFLAKRFWEGFLALDVYEEAFNAGLVDRLMDALRALDVPAPPDPVNRHQHSLQSATLAFEDGADEEIVVAALLHDLGDTLSPYNHSQLAAAILKPYVSERTWWIVQHHGVFQAYCYTHHLGGDRNAREHLRASPHDQACVDFCHKYDQAAFDSDYPTKPLDFFEPMLRRVFARAPGHLELSGGV